MTSSEPRIKIKHRITIDENNYEYRHEDVNVPARLRYITVSKYDPLDPQLPYEVLSLEAYSIRAPLNLYVCFFDGENGRCGPSMRWELAFDEPDDVSFDDWEPRMYGSGSIFWQEDLSFEISYIDQEANVHVIVAEPDSDDVWTFKKLL